MRIEERVFACAQVVQGLGCRVYALSTDFANAPLRQVLSDTLFFLKKNPFFLPFFQHPNVEFRKAKVEKFKWRNGFFYAISQQAKDVMNK